MKKHINVKLIYFITVVLLIIFSLGVVIYLQKVTNNNDKNINNNRSSQSTPLASKKPEFFNKDILIKTLTEQETEKVMNNTKGSLLFGTNRNNQGIEEFYIKSKEKKWIDRSYLSKNNIKEYALLMANVDSSNQKKYIQIEFFVFLDTTLIQRAWSEDFNGTFDEAEKFIASIPIDELANYSEKGSKEKLLKNFGELTLDQQLQKQNQEAERKASIPKLCGEPNIAEETVKHFNDESWIVPRKVTYKEFEDCWYATYGDKTGGPFTDFVLNQIEAEKYVKSY